MDYMKTVHAFAPSKRAFQTQFKRWGFPSKQNPAHKNVDLVARVKELWEQNTSQRDMLQTLNAEGYEIKERELMRVRAKNRWLLRVPNGMKAHGFTEALIDQPLPTEDSGLLALQQAYSPDAQIVPQEDKRVASPPLAPEVIQKRKERFEKLQAESADRYASRKRRRRTRGWAGLPADPPAPPRFPSETTIDESKKYLQLDNTLYRDLRLQFQTICEDAGIKKKTLAGDDQWRQAKDRLIQSNPHLTEVFYNDKTGQEAKSLALDVICTDVTKRMRTLERRMTIAEAKNALGINPEQARQIRNAFYNTLKSDHFTSKLEAGEEHWKALKQQWIQRNPILQLILEADQEESERQRKVKAMEVLCRDVMKRLRDDQTKRDPNRRAQELIPKSESPRQTDLIPTMQSPRASRTSRTTNSKARRTLAPDMPMHTTDTSATDISSLASKALARTPILDSTITDMQIDPSLLQAANNPSFATQDLSFTDAGQPNVSTGYLPATHTDPSGANLDPVFQPHSPPPQPPPPTTIPVYIRPHSSSTAHIKSTKMWLAKLSTRSVDELRAIIAAKYPGMSVNRIDGIEKDGSKSADAGPSGGEVSYLIDGDEELDAYLTHVEGRKVLFVVNLS